ncbi:MAG TPA: hypothetical protein PKD72_03580 [Gemmatales bacterium]|nr:hypothetical protein [Gemmatales bacterium]
MPRVVSCAACQQSLTLPDQVKPGQQIRCPACKFTMVVPGGSSARPESKGLAGTTKVNKAVATDPIYKPIVTPPEARYPSRPVARAKPILPENPSLRETPSAPAIAEAVQTASSTDLADASTVSAPLPSLQKESKIQPRRTSRCNSSLSPRTIYLVLGALLFLAGAIPAGLMAYLRQRKGSHSHLRAFIP